MFLESSDTSAVDLLRVEPWPNLPGHWWLSGGNQALDGSLRDGLGILGKILKDLVDIGWDSRSSQPLVGD